MTAPIDLSGLAYDSPWLTVPEVATRSRRGRTTVSDALRSGELRGYQSGRGGRWRVHRDDVDAWVRGEIAPVTSPQARARAS